MLGPFSKLLEQERLAIVQSVVSDHH